MKNIIKQKKWRVVLFLFLLAAAGIILYRAGMVKGASAGLPGSVSDPLITKSYLEQQLAKLGGGSASFFQISLSKGERLLLDCGSEVVLYSGSASVDGTEGLINLTTGELFRNGNSLVRYNLYLSPADSSGLTAAGNVVVFVQGGYTRR